MRKYAQPAGPAGVTGFEFGPDSITLRFGDGSLRRYTAEEIGRARIGRMKHLAAEGSGLDDFIDRHVDRHTPPSARFASPPRGG